LNKTPLNFDSYPFSSQQEKEKGTGYFFIKKVACPLLFFFLIFLYFSAILYSFLEEEIYTTYSMEKEMEYYILKNFLDIRIKFRL